MKQNVGFWRYMLFGPSEEERAILKDFNEEPSTRRQYLGAVWWNWRKRTWAKVKRHSICKVRGHEWKFIDSTEYAWYGLDVCRTCGKQQFYNEDGTLWRPH